MPDQAGALVTEAHIRKTSKSTLCVRVSLRRISTTSRARRRSKESPLNQCASLFLARTVKRARSRARAARCGGETMIGLQIGSRAMTTQIAGGCACGSIRFTCTSAPVAMLNCHCQDCQSASGAPFASGVVVLAADVQTSGTPTTYSVRSGSGRFTIRSFCSHCGSPLFTQGESNPGFMSIRFPALDDSSEFRPMLDIWISSSPRWAHLDPAIPHFPQSP
jgi:hypothetical protein